MFIYYLRDGVGSLSNDDTVQQNRFANVKVGFNESRMIKTHIRSVQESVADYEELAIQEYGETPTLEGFKNYLKEQFSGS